MSGDGHTPVLVLGLGNVLCEDDGVGVIAVERMRRRFDVPPEIALVDGGTLGLALLPLLEEADAVWLLDAVAAEAPPGTVVALEGAEVEPALRDRLSPHQIGVADLLDALHWRGTWPRRLRILGVVPEGFELRIGLTARVARGVERLIETAVRELAAAGHRLRPREPVPDAALPRSDPRDRVARALGL